MAEIGQALKEKPEEDMKGLYIVEGEVALGIFEAGLGIDIES